MSSIYFDNPLQVADAGSVRCVAWSKAEDSPYLAVAEGCAVRIFQEEGEESSYQVQPRQVPCTSLCWHPRAKVLAIGWEDGAVTFYAFQGNVVKDDREVHRDAAVVCIAFNPAGTRCITTDRNGVVGVWKTDSKGMLGQMCHYRKGGTHDKVVFRTLAPTGEPSLDNPPFFFGGENGIIYLADDFGLCSERYKIGSPLMLLEYFHQKDMVVVITRSVILAQFSLDAEGKVINETRRKLSCGPSPERLQGVWAGPGLLATVSHESIVRLWNLADDESYILSLQDADERNVMTGDKVTSIDFNPRKRVLAAGTLGGRVVQWRCSTLTGTAKSESNWQVLPVITASDRTIHRLLWGPGENMFHISTERSSIIMSEAQLNTAVQPPILALQTAPMQVVVYQLKSNQRSVLNTNFRVKGVSLAAPYLMVWNSKQVNIFEFEPGSHAPQGNGYFWHESAPIVAAALLLQESIAMATGAKIEISNFQGHVQRTLQFSQEVEGIPRCMDVNGAFLVCTTTMNLIKVWNVSRATPKPIGTPRKFEDIDERPLGDIRSVRVNTDGMKVSMLVDQHLAPGGAHGGSSTLRVPDSRLFVYDLDADDFMTYFMGKSRVPVAHNWECTDSRLIAVEVVPQALAFSGEEELDGALSAPGSPANQRTQFQTTGAGQDAAREADEPSHSVMTLFVTGSESIRLQDTMSCADPDNNGAPRMPVALVVPHLFFARQLGEVLGDAQNQTQPENGGFAAPENTGADGLHDGAAAVISRAVLRDFVGLENVDAETNSALLDFSYHLACGNTDEAYKSVKGVCSSGVWESMSKMCVKTGRLDVAQKCLGQMGHARAAGALRACEEPEPEAKLAVVAVHLDMIEDAEQLLRKCNRYDLLNKLYQACGDWEKALEIAQTKDRIHLKPTHYVYAQHLEGLEDIKGALSHFELSGTYKTESPRLLCNMGHPEDLDTYIEQSDDQSLHRWYAQYLESKSQLNRAADEYKKAGDMLSLCRLATYSKDNDLAQKICDDSQDHAACYHLARHFEAEGRTKDAIHYFQMAGRTSHALRLAQEHNFDGDLMSLALSADSVSMAQAAKYYEQRGQHSKAVVLYQKAGCQTRALELCFSARLFDALRKIADDLNADSDPEILGKCAEFFMEYDQHEKAVHLLSMSHQYEKAVDLCKKCDVQITEDMAERMTPDKGVMDQALRSDILSRMANICKKQGSFQLACKKYTQAGDKLSAMQSLLKSGDTEKICFFAGTARQPDIYVLAGNYLQSLDWHNDHEIMKNIIGYYSKAKAHEKLATFYDACAQVEIDEYRDYEKAAGALREALRYMAKAVGAGAENDDRVVSLQSRIAIIEKFAGVRKIVDTDPEQMVQVCQTMLDMPEVETAVRIGDVFAQLVEHFSKVQDYDQARFYVEGMRQRGIILTPYLDRALLETIYRAAGLPAPDTGAQPGVAAGAEDDGIDEEIDEGGIN